MNNRIDLNTILPLVQRPGRYINSEWNSRRKSGDYDVSLCLCFPDLYELGASNLGLEILYNIINKREDSVCERCYCPSKDMEMKLRSNNTELFSLETKKSLKEFDVIGFTLQYELCVTNVINMLDMAGLKHFAGDRKEILPLIIGGGPLTANPEPVADFFDLFVLGDGEKVIEEIIETIKKFKLKLNKGAVGADLSGRTKNELLFELSKISGVYVPSFYNTKYNNDGTINSITPCVENVPVKIEKRTEKLEELFFPAEQIVPFLQTVHSRLNIEVARGCARRCRFCQASKYYWPWRVRSQKNILELVNKGLLSTGYEEVALSSLSCTDYKGLDELLEKINKQYSADRISISIPSLRCDQFSIKIADNLRNNKKSGLTFAPEAATYRLRNVIGKDLLQQDIYDTLILAREKGWHQIKLYFMIGLPTETDEDIDSINDLIRSVRKQAKDLNFNITLSPFVPKPQTPFQWFEMEKEEVLKKKLIKLQRTLPATIRTHNIKQSLLEGIIARGDRKLSKVIFKAWEKGCRFDQWGEYFLYDLWLESFKDFDINPDFYHQRKREKDELLPWDHLKFSTDKQALWEDYNIGLKAAQEEITLTTLPVKLNFRETNYGLKLTHNSNREIKTVQRLRLRFSKKGKMRFISHLEQIELFRRAMRRADMPLVFTCGFHPQPRMSFGPAIPVGYESESEYVEVEMSKRIDFNELYKRMNSSLPEGYELIKVKSVPIYFPSIDSLVNVANYKIYVDISADRIKSFLEQPQIFVEKRKGNTIEKIDVKPLIIKTEIQKDFLLLQMRFGPKRNVKPEIIIQRLCSLNEEQTKLLSINRCDLLIEKKDGTITDPI